MTNDKKCRTCSITLSSYEKDEYKDVCLDCYREEHELNKTNPISLRVRMRNKKFIQVHTDTSNVKSV